MNTVNVLFLNVPRQIKRFLPTFEDIAFVSWSLASEVQCLSEASQSPQTLSAALSLGLRQSQHGQTLAPVSPQQGLQRGLSGGLWANMEITVGIKECIWQKLDLRSRARSSGNIED